MKLHKIHCGILPLENRFIVASIGSTVWVIPAKAVLELATAYYEKTGWYEECELEEDSSLLQPHGEELRGLVEVNADLVVHAKEAYWSDVEPFAVLQSGDIIPPDDCLWWFEEQGGNVEEMTNLPLRKQKPCALLWYNDDFKKAVLKI